MAVYDPFEEMRRMQRELNRVFEHFFGSDTERRLLAKGSNNNDVLGFRKPLADIKQTDENVEISLELPGVAKQDIVLEVKDNMLTLKARRNQELKQERKGLFRYERRYQGFYRNIPLPTLVKADSAQAQYKDGVLQVTIPKLKVLEKKSKIQIK